MKILKLIKKNKIFFSKNDIKIKTINPTMAESFGEKLDLKISDKYLNPIGFLKDSEFEEYEGIDKKGNLIEKEILKLKNNKKIKKEKNEIDYEKNKNDYFDKIKKMEHKEYLNRQKELLDHPEMEKEYGFTTKGPEPTRYGDWQHKGKCVDF